MQETLLNGESMDILADNIQKLKAIFPDVFTEDKVDFEKLEEVLGNYKEDKEERFNFTWNGKSKALRLSQAQSTGTLRPYPKEPEESKNWDTTQNLYIEGDNLEVLKLLQKTYHSRIKMIYIDPPYNTGKEFIYPDNFTDNIQNYLELTGQKDSKGNKISINSETSGRYHTNWLNMMYPRLRLARNLLTDDGVIFISIDDNEVDNLKKLCNEIFGEDNFIGLFIWKRRTGSNDAKNNVSIDHEYIICFAKGENVLLNGIIKDFANYKNPDNDPRGPWAKDNLTCGKTASERPNLYYPITDPKTGITYECNPNHVWRYEPERMKRLIAENKIIFPKNGTGIPMYKRHKAEVRSETKPFGSLIDAPINAVATKALRELLDGQIFDYPKGVDLIYQLIDQGANSTDIILDFFSGSATTAQAVMQLNADDGGNRRFIMAQLPEPCDENSEAFKAGYKNICEIGKERIRRAGKKIKEEIESKNNQLKLGEEPKKVPDIGFKVFKLDSSNLKKWNPDYDNLDKALLGMIDNYVEGRTEFDVAYEIMLKYGIDLTYPIQEIDINGKKLYSIGYGALVICLDNEITLDIADAIVKHKKEVNPETNMVVVFKDNGFKDDSAKTNIKETLKVADIKDFVTV